MLVRVVTIDLQTIMQAVYNTVLYVFTVARESILLSWGSFQLSLFDVMLGLLALSLALSFIFPWFEHDDDD